LQHRAAHNHQRNAEIDNQSGHIHERCDEWRRRRRGIGPDSPQKKGKHETGKHFAGRHPQTSPMPNLGCQSEVSFLPPRYAE
jgi:hypothetical protein